MKKTHNADEDKTVPQPTAAERGRRQQTPEPCTDDDRDLKLTRHDAEGGSPADASVGGEEDAGGGLEFLVRREND